MKLLIELNASTINAIRAQESLIANSAQAFLYDLARYFFRNSEHEVSLLSLEESELDSLNGIPFFVRPQMINRGLPLVSRYVNRSRIKNSIGGADTVAILTSDIYALSKLKPLAEQLGAQIHYLMSEEDYASIGHLRDERFELLSNMLGLCNAVHVNSETQRKLISTVFDLDAKVVPLGVESCGSKVDLGGKKDLILWVGRSDESFQPWQFFDVARANPEYNFVMIVLPCQKFGSQSCFDLYFKRVAASLENLKVLDQGVCTNKVEELFESTKLIIDTSALCYPRHITALAKGRTIPCLSFLKNSQENSIATFQSSWNCTAELNEMFNAAIAREANSSCQIDDRKERHDESYKIEDSAEVLTACILANSNSKCGKFV